MNYNDFFFSSVMIEILILFNDLNVNYQNHHLYSLYAIQYSAYIVYEKKCLLGVFILLPQQPEYRTMTMGSYIFHYHSTSNTYTILLTIYVEYKIHTNIKTWHFTYICIIYRNVYRYTDIYG